MASPMIDTDEVDIIETYAKSGAQAQTLRLRFMRGEIPRLMSEDAIIAIVNKAETDNLAHTMRDDRSYRPSGISDRRRQ